MAQGKTQEITIIKKNNKINTEAKPIVKTVELVVINGALVPDPNEVDAGVNSKDLRN